MHNELTYFSHCTLIRIFKNSQEFLGVETINLGEKAMIFCGQFQSFLFFLWCQCKQAIQQQVE